MIMLDLKGQPVGGQGMRWPKVLTTLPNAGFTADPHSNCLQACHDRIWRSRVPAPGFKTPIATQSQDL